MSQPSQPQKPKFDAASDLQHFLRLALSQVRHRQKTAQHMARSETYSPSAERELNRLRLLEELLKEQLPNEDLGSSAGPAR